MAEDKVIRYVDGGAWDNSGRSRVVYLLVDERRVAKYIGYMRKVEDASMVLYPREVYNSVVIQVPGKHSVKISEIKNK
jgi:hypothetical protein